MLLIYEFLVFLIPRYITNQHVGLPQTPGFNSSCLWIQCLTWLFFKRFVESPLLFRCILSEMFLLLVYFHSSIVSSSLCVRSSALPHLKEQQEASTWSLGSFVNKPTSPDPRRSAVWEVLVVLRWHRSRGAPSSPRHVLFPATFRPYRARAPCASISSWWNVAVQSSSPSPSSMLGPRSHLFRSVVVCL